MTDPVRPIASWLRAAALGGAALGAVETVCILALNPLARGVLSTIQLALIQAGLFVILAIPLALLFAWLERRVKQVRLPSSATNLAVATGLGVALLLLYGVEAVENYGYEFDRALRRVLLAGRGAALVAGAITAWLVARPMAWLVARAPRLQDARALVGVELLLAAAFGAWVVQTGFAAVHVWSARRFMAVVLIAVTLVAFRCLLRGARAWRSGPALGGMVVVALALLAFGTDEARTVAFSRSASSAPALELFMLAGDLDRDGALASYLGGGDCAAFDGERAPRRREVLGDGIDQDCDGVDRSPTKTRAALPATGPWAACTQRDEPWSVLFITVDTLRADHISSTTTPDLSQLASTSAWFLNAYAQGPHTMVAVPALFSGRHLSDQGGASSLVPAFKASGYRTVAITDLNEDTWSGFDVQSEGRGDPLITKSKFSFTSYRKTDAALSELSSIREPFFLWVHYFDPHAPYLAIDDEALPEPRGTNYEREIAYTYSQVHRLLVGLKSSPHADRTLVVFTSDHGEDLGEHGREGHGADLLESTLRVPLALHVPGCPSVAVRQPVGHVDVMGALGLITGVQTRSEPYTLLDAIADRPRVAPVVSENLNRRGLSRAVIDGPWKMIVDLDLGATTYLALDDGGERWMSSAEKEQHAPRLRALHERWLRRPLNQPIALPTRP